MLKNKNVVVGVCGGIAAYKIVEVVSRLKKMHANVDVIMTENAAKFVTPLTFRSISHNPVTVGMFDEPENWDIHHIALAEKADLFLVAPATANILGKVANGIADDMLSTTIMATKAKVLFVPAMNTAMYENPIVTENISKLKALGYYFLEPDSGLMACGTTGKGRLPEPSCIADNVSELLKGEAEPLKGAIDLQKDASDLKGVKVLITSGPTREPIDPVRYISNHSSGKMGFALAEAAKERGADVTVISGPVGLTEPSGVKVIDITTAEEMYQEVMKNYQANDIIIMAAAVADYKCSEVADRKIKKTGGTMVLELSRNPDIAKALGQVKGERLHIGFCAETNDLVENAKAKVASKNFDMIVANDVTMEGAGFGTDTNIVKLVGRDGSILDLPKMSKKELAHRILDEALKINFGKRLL